MRGDVMNPRDELTKTCADCGDPFILTWGEQVFMEAREFQMPRRCRPCRAMRRSIAVLPATPRSRRAGPSETHRAVDPC